MKKYRLFAFVLVVLSTTQLSGQELNRFEDAIQRFEAEDSKHGAKPEAMLFTGSSSIRMWKSLEQDMAPMKVLNRGFGGSTLPEIIYYADRILMPHQPSIIILYCGENDLSNENTKVKKTLRDFKQFVEYTSKKLPETHVFYLSIKPSIKRWSYWPKMAKANKKIERFINRHDQYHFVDVASTMMDDNEVVRQDIFIEDDLHMNETGYSLWKNKLKPILQQYYTE